MGNIYEIIYWSCSQHFCSFCNENNLCESDKNKNGLYVFLFTMKSRVNISKLEIGNVYEYRRMRGYTCLV